MSKNKSNKLKSLRDMDLNEVTILYKDLFKETIKDSIFNKISSDYQKKYNTFAEFKYKGYNSPSAMGRDKIAYGRNIIYGWFVEELMLELFKNNKFVKGAEFFGQDKEHDFIYFNEEKNIKIAGSKSTDPDILVTLKNKTQFLVEIKTAAKNIFSIKKGNVQSLTKSTANYDLSCIILMLDLAQGLYEIKDLNFFLNQKPFPNANMEGQLCYDFPSPNNSFKTLLNLDFDPFLDLSILENLQVKKFRLLKIALEKGNKKIAKTIKNKLNLEKLEEQKEVDNEEYNRKIKEIIQKDNLVLKPWEEIEKMI
jgi:hypothetical protein